MPPKHHQLYILSKILKKIPIIRMSLRNLNCPYYKVERFLSVSSFVPAEDVANFCLDYILSSGCQLLDKTTYLKKSYAHLLKNRFGNFKDMSCEKERKKTKM